MPQAAAPIDQLPALAPLSSLETPAPLAKEFRQDEGSPTQAPEAGEQLNSVFDGGGKAPAGPAFSVEAAGPAFSPLRSGPAPVEKTRAFLKAYRRAQEPPSAEAKSYRYLFIPGFMWDLIPGVHKPNMRAFAAMGLDAELVPVDSIGTMAKNAEIVAAAIARSERPVVLIAHSKGGLDAMAALARFPQLKDKVAGLVAIQTPYFGSAAADLLNGLPKVSLALQAGARLLRYRWGRLRSLFDDAIAELAEGKSRPPVPELGKMVSVVSSAESLSHGLHPLRLSRWAIKYFKGKESDGMVSPEDAVLPGSDAIRFKGLHHGDMIMDPPLGKGRTLGTRTQRPFSAERFTRALVHYLFPADPPPAEK